MIRKFDNLHSPAVRYDFEGNLLDSSGNGRHLTADSTPIFRSLYENAIGLAAVRCTRGGVHDAALLLQGDITLNVLCVMHAAANGVYLVAFQGPGEATATNCQYALQLSQNQLLFVSEHDVPPTVGINDTYAVSLPGNRGMPSLGVPFLASVRRKSSVIQFFLNGVPYGAPSSALTTPMGGSTAQLVLDDQGTNPPDLLGLEVIPSALSDAQIKDRYNLTLGDFGALFEKVQSIAVSAVTSTGASVDVVLTQASDNVFLAVTGPGGTVQTPSVAIAFGETAHFDLSSLDADTDYSIAVRSNDSYLEGPTASLHTLPSP